MQSVDESASEEKADTLRSEVDLSQEITLIKDEFTELLAYGKDAPMTFYVYSQYERLFSFTLSGNPDTYLAELAYSAIIISYIDHPSVIAIYSTTLPYMGNIDNDAVVTVKFNMHDELEINQTPYEIKDDKFVELNDLVANPAVSYASDEILILFKTIKMSHFTQEHSLVYDLINFMEQKGIDFCFYGNVNRDNIENTLLRAYNDLTAKMRQDFEPNH